MVNCNGVSIKRNSIKSIKVMYDFLWDEYNVIVKIKGLSTIINPSEICVFRASRSEYNLAHKIKDEILNKI